MTKKGIISAMAALSLVLSAPVSAFAANEDSGTTKTDSVIYRSTNTTTGVAINDGAIPLGQRFTTDYANPIVKAAIAKAGSGKACEVSFKNTDVLLGDINPDVIKSVFTNAGNSAPNLTLHLDQIQDDLVIGRTYIRYPDALTLKENNTNFTVTYASDKINKLFKKHYPNVNTVLDVGTANLPVAIKLMDENVKAEDLVFYTYDKTSNTFKGLTVASCNIDNYGYLRFIPSAGGTIVVSKGTIGGLAGGTQTTTDDTRDTEAAQEKVVEMESVEVEENETSEAGTTTSTTGSTTSAEKDNSSSSTAM